MVANKELFPISEIIKLASARGVDFGSGNPENRIRYYIRFGLLPHAKRKSFNGAAPTAAFRLDVVDRIVQIEKLQRKGKSVPEQKQLLLEVKTPKKLYKTTKTRTISERLEPSHPNNKWLNYSLAATVFVAILLLASLAANLVLVDPESNQVLGVQTKNENLVVKVGKALVWPIARVNLALLKTLKNEQDIDPLDITNIQNELYRNSSGGLSTGSLAVKELEVKKISGLGQDCLLSLNSNQLVVCRDDYWDSTRVKAEISAITQETINSLDLSTVSTVSTTNLTAFKYFAVSGQSTITAANSTDTLTLVAGSNISLTTNATAKTITINSTAAGGGGGGGDAATLDSLDSLQFLRADTADNFTSGTLTFDAGTTLAVNGTFSCSDCIGDAAVANSITVAATGITGTLTDAQVSDTLTIGVGGSVAASTITGSITDAQVSDTLTASNLVAASSVVADSEVDDNLTIDATGSVNWAALTSYPAACAANNAITTLGDSPTCAVFWNAGNDGSGSGLDADTLDGSDSSAFSPVAGSASITTVGALASGTIAAGFGTISTSSTITGSTLNGTTGINTGAGAGTNRIDASGNLANIGSITASSSSAFSFTSTATSGYNFSLANSGSGLTGAGSLFYTSALLNPAAATVANATIRPLNLNTVANGGDTINGLDIQWNQGYGGLDAQTGTENMLKLGLQQYDTSITDNAVAAGILIDNADTATGNSIAITDAIKITQSGGLAATTAYTNYINATNFTVTSAGAITAASTIAGSEVRSNGNIYVNYDGADATSYLYFYESSDPAGEYLRWLDSSAYFNLSDDLDIDNHAAIGTAASVSSTYALTISDDTSYDAAFRGGINVTTVGRSDNAMYGIYSLFEPFSLTTNITAIQRGIYSETLPLGSSAGGPSAYTISEIRNFDSYLRSTTFPPLVTNFSAYHISNPSITDIDGEITNFRGLMIEDITEGDITNKYPIYQAGETSQYNILKAATTLFGRDPSGNDTSYRTVIQGSLCVDDSTANCPATPTAGAIYVENSVGTGNVSAFDIAEYYPATEPVEKGDLVIAKGETKVGKSSSPYDETLIGVVSTDPAAVIDETNITFGKTAGDNFNPLKPYIALAGRVPTKVSTENGNIEPGDPLTSSSTPGVAMRATKSGPIIGKALESFSGSEQGKILVFVSTSWYVQPLATEVDSKLSGLTDLSLDSLRTGALIIGNNKIYLADNGDLKLDGSIEIAGNIKLSGEIFAKKLNVSDEATGSGTILSGQESIFIETSLVTDKSKIFLTLSTLTRQNIAVTKKETKRGFEVKITSPEAVDVSFDWFVVN